MHKAGQLLEGQAEQQLLYAGGGGGGSLIMQAEQQLPYRGGGFIMQALTHRASQLPVGVVGDAQYLHRAQEPANLTGAVIWNMTRLYSSESVAAVLCITQAFKGVRECTRLLVT